ncbi:MAG TPA: cell envelope integrity protein TolA [Opitutaceae bacterium]
MNTHSPGPYLISAVLHGSAALLVLFFGYASSRIGEEAPRVFELVAGAGTNYAARAAPALGAPQGIKAAPALKPDPSPIQAAPDASLPTAPAKPVDLVKSLKRAEARRENKLEAKYKRDEEAEQKRLTHEEFLRQQAAAKAGSKVTHIDAEGIRDGVIGGSTENKTGGAGGRALTREEGTELEAYFAELTQQIRNNAVQLEGVSDSLKARVEFFLAADGSISHVRILNSSGNHEFDRSAIEAVERTASIGPRPDGKSDTQTVLYHLQTDSAQ